MVDKVLFSSATDQWATPQYLFDYLDDLYEFNLDPCATIENTKCYCYITPEMDGLKLPWYIVYEERPVLHTIADGRVFCNPPYGRTIGKWVEKAVKEVKNGNAELVVMLIPARTDTKWWHDYIMRYADKISFIKGRVKFGGASNPAPFPSVVVEFNEETIDKYFQNPRIDSIVLTDISMLPKC